LNEYIEKEKIQQMTGTIVSLDKGSLSITEKLYFTTVDCDEEIQMLKNIVNY